MPKSKDHISSLKEVTFQKKQDDKSFFDLVRYEDLMTLKPSDHNQFENHKLAFYAVMFFTEGSGNHSINFTDYQFEKGTLFTIAKDNIHKFHPSDAKGYLLVFTEDFIVQYMSEHNASKVFQLFNEFLASPKQQLNPADYDQFINYMEVVKTEFHKIKDEFSLEVIRSLLHIIFTQLLRIKSSENKDFNDNKYLSQFLQFQNLVEQNFQQHKSVSEYADHLSITSRTLNNITNSIVHKSAKAVINDILISKTKRLLINSDFNISQIAFKIGFYEISHFSKFFSQHTGYSPKSFRELFK